MSNIPMTPEEKRNKTITWIVVVVVIIAALAFGVTKLIEMKNAPTEWAAPEVEAPANLQVSFNPENENGAEIVFTTDNNADKEEIRIYEDPSCGYCAKLANEIKKPLAEKISDNANLHVNLMAFLDNNTGTDFSKDNVLAMMTLAENGEAEAAWKYYGAMWENQDSIKDNLVREDFAEIAQQFGASEESVEQIKNASLDQVTNVDQTNQNVLNSKIGTVSTPTMFVNDELSNTPNDPNSWGI